MNAVKYGGFVHMPGGHDLDQDSHSAFWPELCCCTGAHHPLCEHRLSETLSGLLTTLRGEEE